MPSASDLSEWADVAKALNHIATVLALIFGGCFAYVRYIRGRVLHSRCDIGIEAHPVKVADQLAVQITITVINAGSLRIVFPVEADQTLTVTAADAPLWNDACQAGEILWTEGIDRQIDLLAKEGTMEDGVMLEPGERWLRSTLMPLPAGDWIGYRVGVRVEARAKLMWRLRKLVRWESEQIIVAEGSKNGI